MDCFVNIYHRDIPTEPSQRRSQVVRALTFSQLILVQLTVLAELLLFAWWCNFCSGTYPRKPFDKETHGESGDMCETLCGSQVSLLGASNGYDVNVKHVYFVHSPPSSTFQATPNAKWLRQGFLKAIQLCLRLRIGGLAHAGPPCGSFVFLNRFTSGRSSTRPLGNRRDYVLLANETLVLDIGFIHDTMMHDPAL